MIYDVVMNAESIVISEEGQILSVRIMAENNSYLPQGDRYVSLYMADAGQLKDPSGWQQILTVGGKQNSELEYAYPMQKVWTLDAFEVDTAKLGVASGTYLIAQINDTDGTLSEFPETGLQDDGGEGLWSVFSLSDYLKKK